MLIAVDFDGTIVPDDCYPNKPTRFMPGAKQTLLDLHRLGHRLVLWTLRNSDTVPCDNPNEFRVSKQMQMALQFLQENGIAHIFEISANRYHKFPADIYIEDKLPGGFIGWAKVREHFGLLPLKEI